MVKNQPANSGKETLEMWVQSQVRKIPWRRKWRPTPAFLPGKSWGERSLVGFSPCGHRVRHALGTKHVLLCTLSQHQMFALLWLVGLERDREIQCSSLQKWKRKNKPQTTKLQNQHLRNEKSASPWKYCPFICSKFSRPFLRGGGKGDSVWVWMYGQPMLSKHPYLKGMSF